MPRTPKVVAHKGASAYRPGNTRAAFDLAVEQGADCVEMDIQLLADGEVVVYDRWLVDDGSREVPVAELTLVGLRQLLGRTTEDTSDTGLLTLPGLLGVLQQTRVELLLELKNGGLLQTSALGTRVVEELVRANMLDRSLVFSYDHALIASMGRVEGLRKGLLYVARLVDLEATLRATGAEFVETRNDFLDAQLVGWLHARGHQVCGWSTNDPHQLLRLRALDVDMVTTDTPDVARKVLLADSADV